MTALFLRLFVKNYKNTGDVSVRNAYGRLSGIVGIVLNVLLSVAKLIIGTLSGAVSIAADAVNNLSDAASSIVTLIGFHLSSKPADEQHPFGHARVEYLAGLAVAALILVVGVLLAVTSAEKLFSPAPASVALSVPLVAVLLLSILGKLWHCFFNRTLGKKIDSKTLLATSADSRNDVLATAAVLLACIAGTVIQQLTGKDIGGYIDGGMGLLVALFILWSGYGIAHSTISPLLGESTDPHIAALIAEDMHAHPEILGFHDLMVHDYGPGQCFASVHAELDSRMPVLEAHDLIDSIELHFKHTHRVSLIIHYDPIVCDDPELNALRVKVSEAARELSKDISIHDFRMVRGRTHTNLIFDLVLPRALHGHEKEVREHIEQAIQTPDMRYYTVIQFDTAAFNKNSQEEGL